jgi:hypothetical protein
MLAKIGSLEEETQKNNSSRDEIYEKKIGYTWTD